MDVVAGMLHLPCFTCRAFCTASNPVPLDSTPLQLRMRWTNIVLQLASSEQADLVALCGGHEYTHTYGPPPTVPHEQVNDADNVKQDMSIDVYGRKKKEEAAAALSPEAPPPEAVKAQEEEELDQLLQL